MESAVSRHQYGGGPTIFGGGLWLINGERVLGMVVNATITVVLVRHWLRRSAQLAPAHATAYVHDGLVPRD